MEMRCMNVRVELDGDIIEDEIVIRCQVINEEIERLQKTLTDLTTKNQNFTFYKGGKEYYLPLEEILFFETEEKVVIAHTKDDMYQVKYRLYELEDFLPRYFMRISKSTILNTNKVYSIQRNLTASSVIEFQNTHKQIYVSRYYYKPLKNKLEEKRKLT